MEEKKFVHENTGIPISNELTDDEKKYIKSMYLFAESVQIPMLTEKIIILSKKIEKFDKSSSSMSKRLLALTFFLVIIAILQVFIFICQIALNWWESVLLTVIIGLVIIISFKKIIKNSE